MSATWRRRIRERWRAWRVAGSVAAAHGDDGGCELARIEPVRRNRRYSLWRLYPSDPTGTGRPVMLKILGPSRRNRVERNVYGKARHVLEPVLPRVYAHRRYRGWTWIFHEHVHPLAGRHPFAPETFARVMPLVARLHAATFRPGPAAAPEPFRPWLATYARGIYGKRDPYARTRRFLDRAARRPHLAHLLRPHRRTLDLLLAKGPRQFRELAGTGWSVIHGDLHMHNVCCNDLQAETWDIRFIDWETARFAPVWFDLIVLVELLIDFRKDWWPREAQIRRQAVADYVRAMERHGIRIPGDHARLYRLAYLQRTLETGLATQLRRALRGREHPLLGRYLHKLAHWSRDLGLVEKPRP